MKKFTSEKKYYTLNDFYKNKFHSKVFKVALNGDFTCPNRDGSISHEGCIFCSESGSGDFAGNKYKTLAEQFEDIKNIMLKKWPEGKYIAYFQANTNTYGPIKKLRKLFYEALSLDENVIGISIATRPDCLPKEVLDLLEKLNAKTYLTVELGLQTIHKDSLDYINRGHDLDTFVTAVKELRKRNINVVVHIINGIPKETKEMMIDTVKLLNKLDIQGIKIHMLYVQKNTILEKIYEKEKFHLLTLEEYVDIVVSQLKILKDNIVVHRISGDAPRNQLIAPKWTLKKFVVSNEIDKLMRTKNIFQGINYRG